MKYKNIRVTEDCWKKASHLAIEMDKSLGETIKTLYDFYIKMIAPENTKKGRA
jgi:hypothetical protein